MQLLIAVILFDINSIHTIGGGMAPHFFETMFARKDRDTLIQESRSRYSNRVVKI